MNKQRSIGAYLAGLVALAIVAFLLFGAIVTYRIGQPIAAAAPQPAPDAPLVTIARGAWAGVDTADAALARGERSTAVRALDAARRVTLVGQAAAGVETVVNFDVALSAIESARYAIQNGAPAAARANLADAAAALERAAANSSTRPALRLPADLGSYANATVINAEGVRIGELRGIERRGDGTIAILTLGGAHNVFGLFDIGGTQATIPAAGLVYGDIQTTRPPLVALPSYNSGAAAERRAAP